jgi:hypothetical protein
MSEVTDAPVQETVKAETRPLQGSHIWYELITCDSDAATEFYGAAVPGWSISQPIGGDQDYRMIERGDGGFAGGVLRLTSEMQQHGARPIWMGYIGVDDVGATVAEIDAKGGRPFDIPQGRIAMVADPQGNAFYVMKPVMPATNPEGQSDVFSPTAEQRVGWNELTTPDPVAARQFYGALFGWTSEDFMPMGELGEYRFLAHAGTTIGAVCGVQPGGSQGWRYYIRVPSIGRSVEAVNAAGGTIAMGPHEVPGGDQIIIGKDAQGAEFALVGKA